MKKYLLYGLLAVVLCVATVLTLVTIEKNKKGTNAAVDTNSEGPVVDTKIPPEPSPKNDPSAMPTPTTYISEDKHPSEDKDQKDNSEDLLEVSDTDNYKMILYPQGSVTLFLDDTKINFSVTAGDTINKVFSSHYEESVNSIYSLSGIISNSDNTDTKKFKCDIIGDVQLYSGDFDVPEDIKKVINEYMAELKIKPFYTNSEIINGDKYQSFRSMNGTANISGEYNKLGQFTFTTKASIMNNKLSTSTDFTYITKDGSELYGYLDSTDGLNEEFAYELVYTNSQELALPEELLQNLILTIKEMTNYIK